MALNDVAHGCEQLSELLKRIDAVGSDLDLRTMRSAITSKRQSYELMPGLFLKVIA